MADQPAEQHVRAERDAFAAGRDLHLHLGNTPRSAARSWVLPYQGTIVERPKLSGPLLDWLCREGSDRPDAPPVVGVCGAGGFGKTTLVRQVCEHAEVRSAFGAGLVWVTLGEDCFGPALTARICDLVDRLTGRSPAVSSPEQAGLRLGEALDASPGRILLVIDDVWDERQLGPFLAGGPGCRRLVTSRNRWVFPRGARVLAVGEMTDVESRELVGLDLDGLPDESVEPLLARTGRWPVLLAIANRSAYRLVARGMAPAAALRRILDRLASDGPTALDMASPEQRHHAVAATVEAGLGLLVERDFNRFLCLGVFPEDTDIPLAALELLWRGEADTAASPATASPMSPATSPSPSVWHSCEAFSDLALLAGFDPERQTIRLHDLLRDHLVRRTGPAGLARLHDRLLTSAAALLPAGASAPRSPDPFPWWELPDTYPYLTGHLVDHLKGADRADEAAALVGDLRWILFRLHNGGVHGAVTDLSKSPSPFADALSRAVQLNGHLLAPVEPRGALAAILACRLNEYAPLRPAVERFRRTLSCPYLENPSPLPDRPHPALLRTFSGHTDRVRKVVVPADESWLATVDGDTTGDRTVRLWSMRTGEQVRTLTGHTRIVHDMALSPDDSWLASSDESGTVRIWDPLTGVERHALPGHAQRVTVRAAPDGMSLVTIDTENAIRVWDPSTGQEVRRLREPTKQWPLHLAPAAAISPDGAWLACGSSGVPTLWNLRSGTQLHTAKGHRQRMSQIIFAPHGRWLVTSDGALYAVARSVRVWDVRSGDLVTTIEGTGSWLVCVALAADGSFLATGGETSRGHGWPPVRLWDPLTGAELASFTAETASVTTLAIAMDRTWLATGHLDGEVCVWDVATGTPRRRFRGSRDRITHLTVAPGGGWLAAADISGRVRIWDPHADAVPGKGDDTGRADDSGRADDTGEADGTSGAEEPADVSAVVVAPDGGWAAVAHSGGRITVVDCASRARQPLDQAHTNLWSARLLASSDSSRLAASGASSTADLTTGIWDMTTHEHIAAFWGHSLKAFSPDGAWLVTATNDERYPMGRSPEHSVIMVRDTDTGQPRLRLAGHHPHGVGDVVVEPSGAWLASSDDGWVAGDQDRHVVVWDLRTGRARHHLGGHNQVVSQLGLSPDALHLATGDSDGTVRIWDPASGRLISSFTGHVRGIRDLRFAPDSSWLTTSDGTGRLYVTDPLTGRRIASVTGHVGPVNALEPCPSGRLLVSGDSVGVIRVWRAPELCPVTAMRVDGSVSSCAWLPDGSGLFVIASGRLYRFDYVTEGAGARAR
ncbi:NB-ARC domain-containing protein [Streptomyces sp. NPDC041068]|uniref:NB-ARC domain-containing protein n=1 Tax=Streptomyces sp. NPDC041068 TaxID=3155130 RepID=UPI0033EE3F9B